MTNRILIITDDASDAKALELALGKSSDASMKTETVTRLADGLERLRSGRVDAILADLSLPDSHGIDTFDKLFTAAPHTPIMTLSAAGDEVLAAKAVQRGSLGYLSKGHFGSELVPQSVRNMLQRKAFEDALFVEKTRAEITLNSISDAVIGTDMSGHVDYLNIAAENITGWSREEARGRPISEVMQVINGVTRKFERNPVELVLQLNKPMNLTAGMILVRRDGREAAIEDSAAPIHDAHGQIVGAVIVFHDVTVSRAIASKMTYQAQHDFLTDLPNRALLSDRITHAIALAKRHGSQLAVLFLDLDNFKHINDSLGHAIGDKLLQSVAQRLTASVRASDTVSRQGGDEFVILVTEDKYAEDAALTANKILAALAESHSIAEQEMHATTSIGISVYPADGQDAEALIKSADTAMYCAKEAGRNNFRFFNNDMNIRAVDRQAVEISLQRALDRQEFVLHYQPKINLESSQITGAEALLRWKHPEWGLVLPDRFVRTAEECGLIVAIGQWVLRDACMQIKRWQDDGLELSSVAVNISALEFRRTDFVESVRAILNETGLSPDALQLDITESVLMRDAESSKATLHELKAMGVQLAVDDFGTGYSSLSYLSQFPIDVLKIDKSFVQGIGGESGDGIMVSAAIGMGNSLKQRVVAEGVEKQEQLDFLKQQRCEEGQGYLFSRPVGADEFAKLLVKGMAESAGN